MNNARSDILSRLRANQSQGIRNQPNSEADYESQDPENLFAKQDLIDCFIVMANNAGMGVTRLPDNQCLPQAIKAYLQEQQLPGRIYISDPTLEQLEWDSCVELQTGTCGQNEVVSLIHAFAGIAETGTVVSLSSKTPSTASLFLPDACLFILDEYAIEASLEDIFIRIKRQSQRLPRTINLITGPSRTGDIEQTIQIGAHGPYLVEVFLIAK